jgi:hypothetical protein
MKKTGLLVFGFLLAAVMVFLPVQANAASNAIGVNPRRDYTIEPGKSVSDTIFVNNISKTEPLTVKLELVDFEPQNQTGTPRLLLKQTQPTRWSLKPYLKVPTEYNLEAGKSVNVPFTISVPATLGAGSYYSAIRYSAVNSTTGQNVSLTGSAVSLIFVRVTGEAKSNLSLVKFGAFTPNKEMTDGVYGTFYGATKPKYLSYLLRNNGNLAELPVGSIIVKDIFGKQYKVYENANPGKNLVLIGQTRRIDLCLNEERKQVKNPETGADVEEVSCNSPNLAPGRYTAVMNLIYGDAGNTQGEVKQTAVFWYLPAWFIILVIVVLGVLAFGIWKLVTTAKGFRKPTYDSRRR